MRQAGQHRPPESERHLMTLSARVRSIGGISIAIIFSRCPTRRGRQHSPDARR